MTRYFIFNKIYNNVYSIIDRRKHKEHTLFQLAKLIIALVGVICINSKQNQNKYL